MAKRATDWDGEEDGEMIDSNMIIVYTAKLLLYFL